MNNPIYSGSGIYLRRGSTGIKRSVSNEDEIMTKLREYGFTIVDIGSDKIDDIVGKFMGAKIVISIEGGQLSHFVYSLPEDSALLVLQPFDRFRSMYRSWAACVGIRFGFVVGTGLDGGYCFSVDEILKTADLLLNQA
jgi:capsular polysaccharide biosynthesis protein